MFRLGLTLVLWAMGTIAGAQTNLHIIAEDGAWTWFNDPRAVFHNGRLYVGHVRGADGRSVLTSYDPEANTNTAVWISSWSERDDHDNPGLLRLQDGRLMAFYARHSNAAFFAYRRSLTTNPITALDWEGERIRNVSANVTYANPYRLSAEGGRIYNFMRNLNFNPTFVISDDVGTNWSAPKILIQSGTNSNTRPYVKYASDYASRIDFLYTDGHPRNVANSLYHAYYENGALYRTDGSFLKDFTNAPLLHDSGERGSVIYQYSAAPSADPNEHIPTGRAWCWEIVRATNDDPVCAFTVQRDNASWSDDRLYYYYARWTGGAWQKRFVAHAGRPLYEAEDDYAGGICLDPEDPNVVYLSSNAADPFNLTDTTNVPLGPRYELYRGVTADGGLTFSWTAITSNSVLDNLRPYVPRNRQGAPAVIWFRGTYTAYNSFNCAVVGLLTNRALVRPSVRIQDPAASLLQLTNLAYRLRLSAVAEDDGHPAPLTLQWTTATGPTNATFTDAANAETRVSFPQPGHYVLRLTASDTLSTGEAAVTVFAGPLPPSTNADPSRVLWLKLDETAGGTAADSSGNGYMAALFGNRTWLPTGGMRHGALKLNGNGSFAQIIDPPLLDNTPAFTLAYWFRIDGWPAFRAAVVAKCDSGGFNNAYCMSLDPNSRRLNVDVDGTNNRFTSPPLTTGVWYHVALVYNGALPIAQRVQLWIDGRLEVTAAESSASIPNYVSHFQLGWVTGENYYFNGTIDDVRFYRRALGADEIISRAIVHVRPNFHLYDDWITRAFPEVNDPAIIGVTADPDHDGQENFVEFALASDPASPGSSAFRIERNAAGAVRVMHPVRLDPTRVYQISSSSDLQAWQPADVLLTLDSSIRPPGQDEYQILSYRLREAPPAAAFFRLFVR